MERLELEGKEEKIPVTTREEQEWQRSMRRKLGAPELSSSSLSSSSSSSRLPSAPLLSLPSLPLLTSTPPAVETKRAPTSLTSLPTDILSYLTPFMPTTFAGTVKGLGEKLTKEYWNTACGGNANVPRLRTRREGIDFKVVSPYICDNHPYVPPQKLRGKDSPPCCLPIRVELPSDFELLFHFINSLRNKGINVAIGLIAFSPHYEVYSYNPNTNDEKWREDFINTFYNGTGVMEEKVSRPWQRLRLIVHNTPEEKSIESAGIIDYRRNPETGVFESIYPNNVRPLVKLAWQIASDDEERISIDRRDIVKSGESDVLNILKMAKEYGRKKLYNYLLNIILVEYLWDIEYPSQFLKELNKIEPTVRVIENPLYYYSPWQLIDQPFPLPWH